MTEKLYYWVALTSPVEAISQRSTGSASRSRGQENMGAWLNEGEASDVFEFGYSPVINPHLKKITSYHNHAVWSILLTVEHWL